MGCFLACFGGEKDQRPRKRGRKSLRGDRNRAKESYQALITSPPKKLVAKEVVANDDPIPQLREKSQEQEKESFGGGGCRKKVTFDFNVKTCEEKKAGEEEGEGGRAAATPVAFPANHRYGNCTGSDEEEDVNDDTDSDGDEEEEYSDFDDEEGDEEEESYDSCFSLPPENEQHRSRQEVPLPTAVPDNATTARDWSRSRYVHSVLNPVQNLSQWKEAKLQGLPLKNPEKENVNKGSIKSRSEGLKTTAFGPEPPTLKVSDTSVDASLSTWLVTLQSSGKVERTGLIPL